MLIRMKSGDYQAGDGSVMCKQSLLDYLGVKRDAAGIQTNRRFAISADVELITSATFSMSSEELAMSNGDGGVRWVLSTFDLDRYGERIDPQGWDFSQYAKNPVVEWAHRYDIPAIGKIDGLAVDESGLHGLVCFNDKSFDPFGWSIGQRVKAGVIRAGSVGFRVIEIEIPDRETSKDGTTLIFRKQELLEFSICNVPANPWALSQMCNEKLAMSNERSGSAVPFWDCLINDL